MNLRDFIEKKVSRQPDKPFVFFENLIITYQDVDKKINQAANGFLDLGVKKGDRICLMLSNTPFFLYAWFGLCKIGAIMVPMNVSFKGKEISYIINHCEAVGIVVEESFLGQVISAKSFCPALLWIMCTGMSEQTESTLSFDDFFLSMPGVLPGRDLQSDDFAQIAYTSGTTGFPKGAVHSHKNFILSGEAFTLCAGLGPEDRVMTILPLFHSNAQYYSTMGALAAEASLILVRKFSASHFWNQVVRYGATEFNFVGAVGKILCDRPTEEFRSEHKITTAYGAPVPEDVYRTFTQRFGIKNVIDGYGLTEVPRVTQNPIGGKIKLGSIGLPAQHPDPCVQFAEIKIVGEQGKELDANQKGEIAVRSPVMMHGYFREDQKTEDVIRDGWFYTGDLGYKDEEGYLFFSGRKKDIIRRKGENISAVELEAVLSSHPVIAEAAVIAVESQLSEDEIMACIVLKQNALMTPEEAVDWCRGHLADFKIPRYIQFRVNIPKTATNRIVKHLLKEEKDLLSSAFDMESYIKHLRQGSAGARSLRQTRKIREDRGNRKGGELR